MAPRHGPHHRDGDDSRRPAALLQANQLESRMFPKAVSIYLNVALSEVTCAVGPAASLNASGELGNAGV